MFEQKIRVYLLQLWEIHGLLRIWIMTLVVCHGLLQIWLLFASILRIPLPTTNLFQKNVEIYWLMCRNLRQTVFSRIFTKIKLVGIQPQTIKLSHNKHITTIVKSHGFKTVSTRLTFQWSDANMRNLNDERLHNF